MHIFQDLLAAIGVVLNGIPQGIIAMSLGFAIFPTAFSFFFASGVNLAFGSVAPISFQAESLALIGNLGKNRKEYTSMIFFGSVIMAVIGFTGSLTSIVNVMGPEIINAMMAGVGIMLARIALTQVTDDKKIGGISLGVAALTYLISKDLVWTIVLSVVVSTLYAVIVEKYRKELPEEVMSRKLVFIKPMMNMKILRGALSLACLNVGANISYGLVTGSLAEGRGKPVDLNLLTITQSIADMGTSLMGGAPVETIISATGSAPEPVIAGVLMMMILGIILLLGLLQKCGKFVPGTSISGFLFILGAFVVFPENALKALQAGNGSLIGGVVLVVTAILDPFAGLVVGAILKFGLPLIGIHM
jgi:AGZA family xanthine/uracil permease-like MFS transporter